MTRVGFSITTLKLTGPGVADAKVSFGPGLNVISGPSDTGKTFIGECIDYAFGASTTPSAIPEAQRYEAVVLGVKDLATGAEYSLRRSLRGGAAQLSTTGQPDRILAEKHQPGNADTISSFFLSLSGLDGRVVRTNAQGKTRPVSFRDVAHLIVVNEQDIIRKHSPVRSGQFVNRTVEDSVFRLLLSSVDDASVIAVPNQAVMSAESRGKSDLLRQLIADARGKLEQVAPGKSKEDLSGQLARINGEIEAATTALASEQRGAAEVEARRSEMWAALRKVQSRVAVVSELQSRFELLRAQYTSDLRRLESITETSLRLSQLEQVRCPVCGSESKHHTAHANQDGRATEIAQSCTAEAARLRVLMSDLESTISQNATELAALNTNTSALTRDLNSVEEELARQYKPRITDALTRLQAARELQVSVRQALDIFDRIATFDTLAVTFVEAVSTRTKAEFVKTAAPSATEEFSLKVEELLRGWAFPGLSRVTFSDTDQDIVISGRKRSDHGKGVRAITHAAFTIALMYYCADKKLPHPGVTIIDSPMVVYREPDKEEEAFAVAFKDVAYKYLASQENRGQVIILENEDPPTELSKTANLIRFTGAAHGRSGFIPDSTPTVQPGG